nr:TetR/AcrR family transcriptional regulator [Sphingomonas sp. CDS-1]
MARPKDEEKRLAILGAAAMVIAGQGLGASTAAIAKSAGVADGTLFVYFPTKTELFNQLYLFIKSELISDMMAALESAGDLREKFRLIWSVWTNWGISQPARARALEQLAASADVTAASRKAAMDSANEILAIIAEISSSGPLAGAPASFIGSIVEAMVAATITAMTQEPEQAKIRQSQAFEALWAGLSGPVPNLSGNGARRAR